VRELPNAKRTPPAWRRYLRFWGADPTADVDAELEFHVASRTEELIQDGLSPDEARRRALTEFGDVAAVRQELRHVDRVYARQRGIVEGLSEIGTEIRHAGRSLRKAPVFVIVVVLTLSLGIGLNSTIFSLVNAYLFRLVPLPNAERLVVLGNTSPLLEQPHEVAYRDLAAYRELHGVFEDLVGTVSYTESLNETDRTERIWIELTTGNYFSTLRVPLALGRAYTEEASRRNERVIVLSHDYWQRRFLADSSIIGRVIQVDREPRTVLGVAAPNFHGFAPMIRSDGWTPIDETPAGRERRLNDPESDWFNVYGILRPGVSLAQARAALRDRAKALEREFPSTNKDVRPVLVPETRARPVLAIAGPLPLIAAVLLGLTLLVLAVACANVASLLLARSTTKRHEYAVRAALGASRWRLTRGALVETGLLSLAGAAGAFALAHWSTARLAGIHVATDAPLIFDFSPDWRVFTFTLGAALFTTLLAGLLPALRDGSVPPQATLVAGGRSATDRVHQRVRSLLVLAQIAVSVIVLISAGLFTRSMQATEKMDLGFTTTHLLMARFDLSLTHYDSARAREFQRQILERARGLPGVRSAALAARVPFGYSNDAQRVLTGTPSAAAPDGHLIFSNIVSTAYFRTAGPTIVRGREFTDEDQATSQRVAVINEAMAEQLWPGQDPIGKTMRIPNDNEELRIVGLARTSQYMFLGEPPRPFFWTAIAQHRRYSAFLELATVPGAESLIPAVLRLARELDPNVPLFEVRSMEEHLHNGRAMFAVRMGAVFGLSFAVLALVLASVGVYGLVSYSVTQRTREIGIRMAVGATAASVVGLILRQALTLASLGVTFGVVAALGATGLMSSLLFGVASRDPTTFAAAAATLVAIAIVAAWIPARRAATMDAVRALRVE
jgi:predicted permease